MAIAIDGTVHMFRGGQKGLDLGPGTEASHIGREQGEVVQAARGQDLVDQQQVQQVVIGKGDLVTHDESFASLVLGQKVCATIADFRFILRELERELIS